MVSWLDITGFIVLTLFGWGMYLLLPSLGPRDRRDDELLSIQIDPPEPKSPDTVAVAVRISNSTGWDVHWTGITFLPDPCISVRSGPSSSAGEPVCGGHLPLDEWLRSGSEAHFTFTLSLDESLCAGDNCRARHRISKARLRMCVGDSKWRCMVRKMSNSVTLVHTDRITQAQ